VEYFFSIITFIGLSAIVTFIFYCIAQFTDLPIRLLAPSYFGSIFLCFCNKNIHWYETFIIFKKNRGGFVLEQNLPWCESDLNQSLGLLLIGVVGYGIVFYLYKRESHY